MRGLSQRQKRILQFIRDHQSEHGYPPTIREIGNAADISSTSVVDYNLRVLQREVRRRWPKVRRRPVAGRHRHAARRPLCGLGEPA